MQKNSTESSKDCKYFNILARFYTREIFCEKCMQYKKLKGRKDIKEAITPISDLQIDNLSPEKKKGPSLN